MTQPRDILQFWFGALDGPEDYPKDKSKLWFVKDARNDEDIANRFRGAVDEALTGGYTSWAGQGEGRLALILLLDQFTRNIYRDTPHAFAGDSRAAALCRDGIERGIDEALYPVQRCFFYMPLEHAESLRCQDLAVSTFEKLLERYPGNANLSSFHEFAVKHRDVIVRFGRFPHRNKILGRKSTPEELEYLARPGSGF
jgi:uncharacterized protein (DUF924 family)